MTQVLGAVLAGGRSSRFGSDKALALVGSQPLLSHAIDTLRDVTQAIVVCGREWPNEISLEDRPAPGMGPLGGLSAALHYGQQNGFEWVLTLACDTPFVSSTVLSDLISRQEPVFVDQHPVIGLWPTKACEALDQFLVADGKHCLRAFGRSIAARPLQTSANIANFNFEMDLQRWLAGPESI